MTTDLLDARVRFENGDDISPAPMTPTPLLSPPETDLEASPIKSSTSPERDGGNTEKADAFRSSRRIRDVLERVAQSLRSVCTFSQSQKRHQRPRHLGGVEGLEPRLYMSGMPAEVRYVDANGAYTLRTETVAEHTIIDFSTLEQGVHAQEWTTNVPGLGNVTMWFQGGAKVDSNGVSAVTQPVWGTSWFIRFNDRPVTIKSAELDFMGTSPQGQLGMQVDGDYLRENNRIVYLPLQTSVNIGGRTMSVLDASQRNGKVAVKSVTLETSVTREVKDYVDDEMEGVIELLAAARQVEPETVTETVTEVKTIDFRSLEQGVHGEQWTTNVPGLGNVTMWFQGGTKIDSHGMSAVTQPDSGTGFWIRFDDGPLKVLSAELDFMGTNPEGRLGMQVNGDYIRENDRIVYLPLQTSVDVGGRTMSVFDEAQRYGKVAVRSITVETSVTRQVKKQEDPAGKEMVLAPVSAALERIGNDGVLGLRISTPLDETYLKTTNYGVIRTEHTGGADNLMIFNNYLADMMENEHGSATKVWTIYGDKDLQIPLAELTFVGNRSAVSLVSTLAQPVRRDILPDGVEYEKAPAMHVAHLEGPNAIFEASSSVVDCTIEFAGVHDDSILGRATVKKSVDGVQQVATITMNPTNATGDYHALMTGTDGRVFGRVLLHWDRDTKQLSLPNGTAAWTASEEFAPTLDAAKTSLRENLVDISTTDQSLGTIQREILLSAASSMPGIGVDFDAKFFEAHPEWSATLRECMTPAELRTLSDTYGILRNDFGTFQSMLGDFLRQGTSILTQIRNGGNETALRDEFARVVSVAATSLPMYRLASIGITMPAGGMILEAAKGACEQTIEVLHALKSKNVLQQMNQQTFAGNGLVANKDGTYMVANDLRLEKETYYVDTKGRLSILQPGTARTLVGGLHGAAIGDTNDIVDMDGHIDLGRKAEIHIANLSLHMQPNGYKVFTFELTQDDMVNIDVPGITNRNLSITIQGVNLPAGGYTSNKAKNSGESVSLKLTAGRYTVTVQDTTNYTSIVEFNRVNEKTPFDMKVNIDAETFNNSNIVGKISIEGNEKVMPVSMRVAEFDDTTGKRIEDYANVSNLKTDKPVWVVVHGMNSNENETKINELVKALHLHPSMKDMQIVTVDWHDAAVSASSTGTDAPWTTGVGAWVAQQLLNLGFSPSQISGIGHSHGTYMLHGMGEELMRLSEGRQMNSLIALDPAGNPFWTGFDHTKINFANVSARSTAFEIAWVADSDQLASTADLAFKVDAPTEWKPYIEHSLGMNLFINQLNADRNRPGNMSQYFGLDMLRSVTDKKIDDLFARNRYGEMAVGPGRTEKFAEALITVDVDWTTIQGKDFAITTPRILKRYNPNTGKEETISSDLILP